MADALPSAVSDVDWAEKHRPQTLAAVIGNHKAVTTMRGWAEAWSQGVPEKRALVLEGKPGIGKTTAAHALARDLGWGVIELNASDARNAAAIERVATQGALHQTFTDAGEFLSLTKGGRKLIILDEADNLYERIAGGALDASGSDVSDRGGKRAIIDTIARTQQPIVLIVNDYYELTRGSGAALKRLTETVKFARPQARSVARLLADVCRAEGIDAEPEALMGIADHSEGDVRAAINDLQSVAQGKTRLSRHDIGGLGFRDTGRTVFQVLPEIFKGTDLDVARRATRDTDENPESFILWIDENLPLEYTRPADLARGYDRLSRADVFLGRVRRRQYYGLWSYAGELMTAGVAAAKDERPHGWARYQFPQWLLKMSRSRAVRNLRGEIGRKIGGHVHSSRRQTLQEDLPFLARLMDQDEEFAAHFISRLGLTAEEVAHILNTSHTTKRVKGLMESAATVAEERQTELGAEAKRRSSAFDAYDAAGEDGAPAQEDEEAEPDKAPKGRGAGSAGGVEGEEAASEEAPEDADDRSADDARKKQKNLFDF